MLIFELGELGWLVEVEVGRGRAGCDWIWDWDWGYQKEVGGRGCGMLGGGVEDGFGFRVGSEPKARVSTRHLSPYLL